MQPRLVALFALSFVLYVVASVGAAGGALDLGALALALVAAGSASAPLWLPPSSERSRPLASVPALGVVGALGLAAFLALRAQAQLGELLCALTLPAVGVTVLRLALYMPDRPPALVRERLLTPIASALALLGGLLGACAALPPLLLGDRALIAPHVWSVAPVIASLACLAGATALRLFRRRLGSGVQALAENLWASLGLVVGELTFIGFLVLRRHGVGGSAADVLLALAGAVLLLGHAFAVLPSRARVASVRARALCLIAIGALIAALPTVPLAHHGMAPPLALGAAFVVVFLLVQWFGARLNFRLLAPAGGTLLEAVDEVRREALSAGDAQELAARLLKPLRRASGLPEAAPILWGFDPPRVVQLDAAGFARVVDRAPPSALTARLRSQPGESLITDELRARLRRRPELDAVVKALAAHDALCVVPLRAGGELQAALLVARGARRAALTLEELHALERLADELAPKLECFFALERAQRRADDIEAARAALALTLEEQTHALDALGQQTSAVKAALGLPLPERDAIGYSPVMRALSERLARIAPQALPVLLWGETGLSLAPIAQTLHRESGRSAHPFVIVDCAALTEEAAWARLFGIATSVGVQPGLLSLLGEGTLLLVDLPALPGTLQRALAELLSERRAQPLHSHDAYPFTGRLVATARRAPAMLLAEGALVPELARWFEASTHGVPPLRERPEDLESLLLLALDRAARVLGKSAKGVEASALELLLDYHWPGNDAELISVIERAVEQADGPRIGRDDLPPLALEQVGAAGSSFAEQERAILRRALRRAGGNHTAAAKALGLRRAELIEKLGQLELEDKSSAEN